MRVLVNCCQLLSATLFNTLRLQIVVDYSTNCSLAECCFSHYLPSCSVSLWHVFLAQHNVTNGIQVHAPSAVVRYLAAFQRCQFYESCIAVHQARIP